MATDRTSAAAAAALLGAALCAGCLTPQGILFTRTTLPYSFPEHSDSRIGAKSCRLDVTQIKEPFTRANLSVLWTDKDVSEALRRAGVSEIRYADLETLSVLNGIYARRRLIFYGE